MSNPQPDMRMRTWHLWVVVSMLAGPLYALQRQSKTGLCELVCADSIDTTLTGRQRKSRRIVPCFVLPVAGCSAYAISEVASP